MTAASTIFTIGHSTRSVEELADMLRAAGVTLLVDIRSIPRSRAMPQFNRESLPASLEQFDIEYTDIAALGGRRHRGKGAPPSRNQLWRVAAFRHYADYAESTEFRAGLDELIALSHTHVCAIMCAEAVWWRCHRRIVADYLLARGIPVEHIMGIGHLTPASLTPGAVVQGDGTVRYPAPADEPASDGES